MPLPNDKDKLKQSYKAEVYIDATKGNKAKWIVVANNVPRITALSRGAEYVDQNISARFRVKPQKGKVQALVETSWNVLQEKFRSYASKSKVKVGLKNEWIERQKYRADKQGEVATISSAKTKQNNFRLF